MLLNCFRSRRVVITFLLLSLIGLFWLPVSLAYAQGGVAMSGPFCGWQFEMPQGSETSSPEAFAIVFNNSDEALTIRMTSKAPDGVEVALSKSEFLLEPGAQQKVFIAVSVSEDAIPGEYDLIITATASRVTEAGKIGLATALAMRASLTVVGEAAWANISVVSPDGEPVVAVVRLFKIIEGREKEFAYSDTGTLEVKVSPGQYLARAYVGGEKLTEEAFDIAADETKTITFSVRTVYFAGVCALPNYYTETGELAFAKVAYTLFNLYQPMADVEVILKVTKDGVLLEQIPLLSLDTLDIGSVGGSHNYIPPRGWKNGKYGFKLELYTEGKLYTTTLEVELEVAAPSGVEVNWAIIGGIIVAVVVVAAGVAFVARRRRQSI